MEQFLARVFMEVSNQLVSWFIAYLGDLQPTLQGLYCNLFTKNHGHPSRQCIATVPRRLGKPQKVVSLVRESDPQNGC